MVRCVSGVVGVWTHKKCVCFHQPAYYYIWKVRSMHARAKRPSVIFFVLQKMKSNVVSLAICKWKSDDNDWKFSLEEPQALCSKIKKNGIV
jgi:glutathionyl-hydroquinone reductase